MHKALKTLLRVRSAEQKMARLRFAEAERSRIAQDERIGAIRDQIYESHDSEPEAGEVVEAHDLAAGHSFRLRRQVQLKREYLELRSREALSNGRRTELGDATKEARVVEVALENRLEEDRIEEKRAQGRKLDSLASRRWWGKNE